MSLKNVLKSIAGLILLLAAAASSAQGTVPWVIPDSLDWLLPAAVWGDAAVTVPSTVYERYGDRDILRFLS